MLYQLLKTTHSLTAYIVLVVLCFAVINAALGVWQKRKYEKKDLRINLFALIFTHLQVTLGLILYFVTPLFFTPLFKKLKINKLEELSWNGVLYGKALARLIDFLITAFLVFLVIKYFGVVKK